MTDPESAATRIRRARETLRWPRSAVASLLRIQPYAIYAYERGDRSAPPGMVRWLEALARAMERALKAHPPPPSPAERQGWQKRSGNDASASTADTSAPDTEERIEDSAHALDTAALDSARLG